MKINKLLLLAGLILNVNAFAQNTMTGIPDSVQNVSYPGSSVQYNISNPLNHSGTSFINAPVMVCFSCKSDYLYFYDLGLNIPINATITGIEVIHTRGGCNTGAYVIDTLQLVYNGNIVSIPKRDSTTSGTDTLGSLSDTWSAALTPAILNSNSFGLFINSSGSGICTFGQFDVRVIVYYSNTNYSASYTPNDASFNIYPDPSSEAFTISFPGIISEGKLEIFSVFGEKIYSDKIINNSRKEIHLKNISEGAYFVRVFDGEKYYTKKIIIATHHPAG